ncbi:hypothetical protein ACWDRX_33300 [Streptomyces nigra]
MTNPDGSVTSLGDDGRLTTTFPDGSVQTVDPSTGQVSTTDPDGTTTTQDLGSLGDLNGNANADLGDIDSDLPTQSETDLGDLGNLNSDLSGLETPTGGSTQLSDGDIATDFRDGSRISFDPDSGLLNSTDADGTTTTTDLTHGATVNNPDGSKTSLDNGMLTTEFPDGSKQVVDPDTGIATITDPQGNTERIDLHDLNTPGGRDTSDLLDGLGDLPGGGLDDTAGGTSVQDLSLSDLGVGGGAGDAASGVGIGESHVTADGSGGTGVDPLSDGSADNAAIPLAPAAGAPGAPGMPGSPGMPMGGMGAGGMGAGGDKGNGERVRAVLVDAAEESERRNRRRRNPWNRQEDDDTFLAPASRVATTGGDSPEEETQPGRARVTSSDYLEEDADVWGTEEGGTPAVIGR